MTQPCTMRISHDFGNKLICETSTDILPVPRIGETIEIEMPGINNNFYGTITKVEYYYNPINQSRCIYVVCKGFKS